MSHRNAYILLSLVALLWAGNFPASKIGLSELGPITLTTARAVLVTPVIVLSWAILGEPIRWYHAIGATVVIAGSCSRPSGEPRVRRGRDFDYDLL